MNVKGRRANVVFIDFIEMPEHIKRIVADWPNFGNDRILEYISEMYPAKEQTWAKSLTNKNLHKYYEDQVHLGKYTGLFEDFIVEWGLEFDVWLLESEVDLNTNILLVNIGW